MPRSARLLSLLGTATLALSAFAQSTTPAAPHAVTLDDLFRFHDVANPEISPDAQWVLYTVAHTDETADKRLTDLYITRYDGSETLRLTYSVDNSPSQPRWSPDGKYISFETDRPGKAKGTQVWVLDRRGGEARQLTDIKGHLGGYAWSPDGKKLLLAITADDDKKDDKDKKDEKPKPIVIDRYHFKQDVDGYLSDNKHELLYLWDVDTHKLEKLTNDANHDENDPKWSPDGSKIAFVSNHDADPDRTTNSDVFVVDARPNSAPKKLTTFDGPDGGRLAWSPDSKWIAYTQGSEPKFEEYNQDNLALVAADGTGQRLVAPKLDRSIRNPVFSADGKSITVLVEDDRNEYPAEISLADGSVKRLIQEDGVVTAFNSVAGKGAAAEKMVFIRTTDTAPGELFAFDNGQLHALTHENDALLAELKLGKTLDLEAKSPDGATPHALLTLPPDAVSGKKYPMLLRIHGGPNGQDAHAFNLERQLFAARGYAVLNVNYRGSSGRGKAWQESIFADWGHHEVTDLLASVDEAVKEGYADPDHLGVGGWSYGGILTDYTIASTTRFKAAISGAGMGNPIGLYGIDEYVHQYNTELLPPWKAQETYIKLAYPLYHADRIRTPTLYMGGDKDMNVPLNGGEQMYQALRTLEVPSELVIYPGQFHGFTKPSFIKDRYQRYFAWYDKWILGKIDATPTSTPAKDAAKPAE
ncbi:alpha/beta hydrolase family protein [Silvibacterium dinghuense]|uniref:S9 family peptidase n=1 Tax=Silvibacterium dinghuense TaxID=1560006 RepID=A0A4Q1SIB4_9BACT|nr:S9 family peptidase [Silvibacterium dinghuense]RXS97348.1 S9 family peptidase [Silvibacterium dinghuense]